MKDEAESTYTVRAVDIKDVDNIHSLLITNQPNLIKLRKAMIDKKYLSPENISTKQYVYMTRNKVQIS